jgi:hypothetical protein
MPGHNRPNSKDSTVPVTVPVTMPMANWTAITADQRRASCRATASVLRSPR